MPRQCGIATCTTDICEAVAAEYPRCECIVGAVNDRPEGYDYSTRIRFEIDEKEVDSYRRAADFLNINNVEVVSVQHEFGIYGGPAGSHLLTFLREGCAERSNCVHARRRDGCVSLTNVLACGPGRRQCQIVSECGHRNRQKEPS